MPLLAQRSIVGRVTDRATGERIPGATVLLGPTRGVPTQSDGTFVLPLDSTDHLPLVLRFFDIGYYPQQAVVSNTDSVRIRLVTDTTVIHCGVCIGYPRLAASLWGGARYAPLGGLLHWYGQRYLGRPLLATLGYQTNLGRNHRRLAALAYAWDTQHLSFTAGLRYDDIRLGRAGFRFASYRLTTQLSLSQHS